MTKSEIHDLTTEIEFLSKRPKRQKKFLIRQSQVQHYSTGHDQQAMYRNQQHYETTTWHDY